MVKLKPGDGPLGFTLYILLQGRAHFIHGTQNKHSYHLLLGSKIFSTTEMLSITREREIDTQNPVHWLCEDTLYHLCDYHLLSQAVPLTR